MTEEWKKRWDDRYQDKAYAYGVEPNDFFKNQIRQLQEGHILFGAEGEGRNAVYAAQLGWNVEAFDISTEGQKKALHLANENNVSINYHVGYLPELDIPENQFDAIALIYAHFPPPVRSKYHQILNQKLKSGGTIIFEAFSKKHLDYRERNPKVGGPANIEGLFSLEDIKRDFPDYDIELLEETEVELNEGLYHNGTGSVIRFVGRKR
jgi:SAM-dependent methyltransferase